jgi:hypothetical protein
MGFFLDTTSAHQLLWRKSSLVPSDVDLGGLGQVKFFVGGFLHQVEHRVLKDELHQFNEGLLHEHLLAEQFFFFSASHLT